MPTTSARSIALHPIHRVVDALADSAGAVSDPRLKQLLYRTGCAFLDHALDSTRSNARSASAGLAPGERRLGS